MMEAMQLKRTKTFAQRDIEHDFFISVMVKKWNERAAYGYNYLNGTEETFLPVTPRDGIEIGLKDI